MPPPPPHLMDELVEEILLRLPPDSPASLVRAGLVCKRWRRLVSDAGFQRRFREFHRSPPTLGTLETCLNDDAAAAAAAAAYTTTFVPKPGCGLRGADHPGLLVRECRHGRVLLYSHRRLHSAVIVVWDPITGERVQLPKPPPLLPPAGWTFAVLCAAAAGSGACDHLDCHGGPFIVVLVVVGTEQHRHRIFSYVYSSESGEWSEPTSSPYSGGPIRWPRSTLLVGNALYFAPRVHTRIMEYDLGTREIATIDDLPMDDNRTWLPIELVATMDGRLGFASVEDSKLRMWSREREAEGGRWALCRVIDLDKLFSIVHVVSPRTFTPYFAGSIEGTGVVFLMLEAGRLIAVDLWSGLVREAYDREPGSCIGDMVVPYKSFFTPRISID